MVEKQIDPEAHGRHERGVEREVLRGLRGQLGSPKATAAPRRWLRVTARRRPCRRRASAGAQSTPDLWVGGAVAASRPSMSAARAPPGLHGRSSMGITPGATAGINLPLKMIIRNLEIQPIAPDPGRHLMLERERVIELDADVLDQEVVEPRARCGRCRSTACGCGERGQRPIDPTAVFIMLGVIPRERRRP